jgi:hypothetical protein
VTHVTLTPGRLSAKLSSADPGSTGSSPGGAGDPVGPPSSRRGGSRVRAGTRSEPVLRRAPQSEANGPSLTNGFQVPQRWDPPQGGHSVCSLAGGDDGPLGGMSA